MQDTWNSWSLPQRASVLHQQGVGPPRSSAAGALARGSTGKHRIYKLCQQINPGGLGSKTEWVKG